MTVRISSTLTSIYRNLLSKYILLLMIATIGSIAAHGQCNPNVALTHTGNTCLGTDTLVLTGTDSVVQITWYNGTAVVSAGTDTFYIPTTAGTYHAMVAAGSCADTTVSVTITPTVTPSIGIAARGGDSVCLNSAATFTAVIANGGITPIYQWIKDGAVVGSDSVYTDSIPTNGSVVSALLISTATCRTADTAVSGSITLTVLPLPSATVQVQGSLSRCVGDSVRLTAPTGDTYLWSNGDTARIIYAHAAGPYDVTVTNANGCSAVSNADTVRLTPTVQPAVSVTTDTGDTICLNTEVTFYAQSVNGGSNPQYQWKRNGVDASNTATYIGTVLHNGDVITCVLTSNATCASPKKDTSDAITLVVNALPAASINGSAHVCASDTNTLTASPANGSYLWSDGETTTSISVTAAGSYSVTVTDQNGCSAGATPIVISAASSATATITQTGDSLYTSASAQFYQWYYNGTIIAGATGPATPLDHSGSYQVATIDSNGCRSISTIDTIYATGINNIALISGMKVYPNPSNGVFTMVWSDDAERNVRIVDAIGNVVADDKAITARSKQYDLSNAATGLYYVQVSQGANTATMKVSVVR